MTSQEKKMFTKLFKTELGTHKVELALLDNLKRVITDGKSIYDRGVEFINKKTALQKESKTLNADSKALLNGGEKFLNDFISTAKDLGIDVNSIKEVEQARNTLGVLNTVLKQTENF